MKIYLAKFSKDEAYFEIFNDNKLLNTSSEIAKFFNMNVDLYNKLLIDKVIQHDNYEIEHCSEHNPDNIQDLSFNLNYKPRETYLNRFKETFIDQLTLISLGGY